MSKESIKHKMVWDKGKKTAIQGTLIPEISFNEIIKLIQEGLQNKKIAKNLCISENTIKTHRKNIYKKANCKIATELINNCIVIGLL
jgi:DNA-binding NarL/FixJ family response regulator